MVGCNDEIFVDKISLPDKTEVMLQPSEGDHVMLIPTEGLIWWGLENAEPSDYLNYYGGGGIAGPDSPATELTTISYEDFHTAYSISINGNYLYFYNYYNCTGMEENITVILKYADGIKSVLFHIQGGEKLEAEWTRYFGNDIIAAPSPEKKISEIDYENSTEETVRVYVMPYKNAPARAVVSPDEQWVGGLELKLALPMLLNDTWVLNDDNYVLKCSVPYEYEPFRGDLKVPLDIPAGTAVRIKSTVSYSEVKERGEMYVRNPYTNDLFASTFTLTTLYPVSYEIKVEKRD